MDHVFYIFASVIAVLSLLYYHLTSNYGYWKGKLIPCLDGAIPGLGNIHPMLFLKRNWADMCRDFYNQMPECSMIGFYHLREPALLVRDPELVKTVMSKNFQSFAKNNFDLDKELDPLLAINPFFAEVKRWKISRQQLSSAFTSGKLKYMYESVNEACIKLKEYLKELDRSKDGEVELELKDLFSKYTAEVVASAAFGVDGGNFKSDGDGPFREMGKLLFEPSIVKGITQTIAFFVPFLGKLLRIRIMPVEVDRFFRKVVRDVLTYREENGIQRQDFLQLMIQYKEAGAIDHAYDQEFDDTIITAHATSFFADGYETSSITMSFLAYQLAAHPQIQDRVRAEVTDVIAKHGGMTYEALQEMTYMDQVLNESMRLYPAFGALSKICTQEFELVGSDGLTHRVAPGTAVIIPSSALQRDPEYWPDPEKFDPERFSEENKHSRHKFVFLPFGEGPRICPGMRMAALQMKAGIATFLQNFTWEVSLRTKEPIQLDPNYFMSAAIGGLWVNVKSL